MGDTEEASGTGELEKAKRLKLSGVVCFVASFIIPGGPLLWIPAAALYGKGWEIQRNLPSGDD